MPVRCSQPVHLALDPVDEAAQVVAGAQVLGAPQHPYTQRLLASLPVPDPAEQAERREQLRELRRA